MVDDWHYLNVFLLVVRPILVPLKENQKCSLASELIIHLLHFLCAKVYLQKLSLAVLVSKVVNCRMDMQLHK